MIQKYSYRNFTFFFTNTYWNTCEGASNLIIIIRSQKLRSGACINTAERKSANGDDRLQAIMILPSSHSPSVEAGYTCEPSHAMGTVLGNPQESLYARDAIPMDGRMIPVRDVVDK
jgi:hypothetical protein